MKLRRKPKNAWELRKGDLPPRFIARREPRLANLENNAAFRLIYHGRHRRGDIDSYFGWFTRLVVVPCVIIILHSFPLIDATPMIVLLFISVAGVSLRSGNQSGRRSRSPFLGGLFRGNSSDAGISALLGIKEELVPDLYISGCKPVEIAAGLAGSALSRRAISNLALTVCGTSAVCIYILLRPEGVSVGARWFAALNLGLMVGYGSLAAFAPFHILPVKLNESAMARVRWQARNAPTQAFALMLSTQISSGLLVLLALTYVAALAFVPFMSTFDLVTGTPGEPSIPLVSSIAVGGGALFGLMRGLYVFSAHNQYFRAMSDHIEVILTEAAREDSE